MTGVIAATVVTLLLARRASASAWREPISAALAAAAGYVLLTLLFFWQWALLPDARLPRGGGDLVSFLFPTYRFAADQIQAGVWPFWNPHQFAGMPFAADLQSGIYYPINLAAFLLVRPFEYDTLELLAVGHYPIAALGGYTLARHIGATRLGAFASGIAYAFSGFMVAHLGHYNMLAAATWAPFAIAMLIIAIRSARLTTAILGAAPLAMALLAGHIQAALYLITTLTVVWLFFLWRGHRRLGQVASLPLMILVAALASAVLLIPAFELTKLSIRADITYAQASEFRFSPLAFVTFLIPGFFGSSAVDFWGLPGSLQESYGYIGVAGLCAAGVAFVSPLLRRAALALAMGGAFALVFALGEATPLHGLAYRFVPGFDKVRAPGRALQYVDLVIALLAGLGISALQAGLLWKNRPMARAYVRLLIGTLVVAIFVVGPIFYVGLFRAQVADPTVFARTVSVASSLVMTLCFLVVTTALMWLWIRARVAATTIAAAVVAVLAFDLASASGSFNPTTADILAGYRHAELFDWLRGNLADQRIDTRTGISDSLQPNAAMMSGLDDVNGLYNPLLLRGFNDYWESLGSRSSPGYGLLAVGYVIARPDTPLDASRFRPAFQTDSGLTAFEHLGAHPRAFVAPRAEVLTRSQIYERLRDTTFDPRSTALVEEPLAGIEGDGVVVDVVEVGSNEVRVRLRDVAGGVLILADVNYPGWRARVDDRVDVPVTTAYGLFRGLPLPIGAQEVTFTFEPERWRLSLALTVIGWLTIGVALVQGVIGWKRRALQGGEI